MTPTIPTRDGKPWMIVGTPGGAPALGAAPVGDNRFYGVVDPRRNTGLALGY